MARAPSPAPRRRSSLRRLATVVAATLLAFLLCEAITRIGGFAPELHRIRPGARESAYRSSENPVLGYEFKPDYRCEAPDLYESFPFTNSHGQRDVERTVEKGPGTRRILVLGDSVVAGHGIREVRETIPLRLERLLEGNGTEVLNFGVGGYCTRSEVELLRVKGLRFQPDVVVVVYVPNDVFDLNEQAGNYRVRVDRPGWTEWLFVRSHLFRLAAMGFDWFGFRSETDPEVAKRRHAEALGDGNVDAGISLLLRLSEEHGFDCFVVVWPCFLEDSVADAEYDPAAQDGPLTIERVAKEYGVPVYRLSDFFKRDQMRRSRAAGRPISPIDYYTIGDSMHPSPAGAEVGATAIAEILRERER